MTTLSPSVVRVFVPTFRRSHLLQRALRSLQQQTFVHWIAEVHNDAPDDPAPAGMVAAVGDPRINYVPHPRTLGGAAVFNLAFNEQREPFIALLEDDNWWQPNFLQTMLDALYANPRVTVAWANQSIWEETESGEWRDSRTFVRPVVASKPIVVSWPHPAQCLGALHAHGTIVLRTTLGRTFPTPEMDLGGVEAVRERSLPHPMLYVPEPLGVFGATRVTNRSSDPNVWATNQVLLAATFLKHVNAPASYWSALWQRARVASPRMTGTLLLASRQDPSLQRYFRLARQEDWRHLAIRSVRRPRVFLKLLRARQRAPEIWRYLDRHTADRAQEAAQGDPPESPAALP